MHYVNQKLRNFPFFGSVNFPRKLQLNKDELKENISLMQQLQKEYQSQNVMKDGLMLSLMSQIFILSTRQFSKDFDTLASSASLSYFKHYQEFETVVEQYFTTEKSITFYASLLNITSKHLNRITQTVVHKTATDVITERVILEAKRMLMYLDESLGEIAFRLGYEEYSYFVRVFRKTSGMTPTQFIKMYKS
jgi:AraC-like DNA-binding protein